MLFRSREQPLVDELGDRVRLFQAVLEGRSGEREEVGCGNRLEHARRLRGDALHALGLVDDQEVGCAPRVIGVVAENLFVVGDEPGGVMLTSFQGSGSFGAQLSVLVSPNASLVPEPAGILMMTLAAMCLGSRRWLKQTPTKKGRDKL